MWTMGRTPLFRALRDFRRSVLVVRLHVGLHVSPCRQQLRVLQLCQSLRAMRGGLPEDR